MDEKRNILVESARIARGNILPIEDLHAKDYDMLFLPGGFGAAKNFSNFAFEGKSMSVEKDIEYVLKDF